MNRILYAALVAGILTGCAAGGGVNEPDATATAGSETRQFSRFESEVDAELSKNPAFRSLKQHFPSRYDEFVSGVSLTADAVEARRYSTDWMRTFTEENASLATGAPDAALIDWLEASLVYMQAMRRTVGPEICSKMAAGHPDYVALRNERFIKELTHRTKTLIDAFGASLRDPTIHDPATPDDYKKMGGQS